MLTAGAAHGDGQVTSGAGPVGRKARMHEFSDFVDEGAHAGLIFEKTDHGRIAASQRAQCRFPVRVGERAGVEDKIGVARNAMLEAEGLELQRQAFWRAWIDPAID